MDYDYQLCRLSAKFIQDYPLSEYPELLYKAARPYTCLLIETHCDYFICVPFRSNIEHKNAFMFSGTARSQKSKSGLDYSKIVIIKDNDYFDTSIAPVVDSDEYNEMVKNLPVIVQNVNDYVDAYINHINGTLLLHPREYTRRYKYSTLPYFHNILGL